jgi:hypothetical protein
MADPKLVARLNSGPCCWRGRELTEVRLLWTVCYWESLLMALIGAERSPVSCSVIEGRAGLAYLRQTKPRA